MGGIKAEFRKPAAQLKSYSGYGIITIMRGIYIGLYSMNTKTQSTLQGLVGDSFMAQVATVTILI